MYRFELALKTSGFTLTLKKRLSYQQCAYVLSQGWCLLTLLWIKGRRSCSLGTCYLSQPQVGLAGLQLQPGCSAAARGGWVRTQESTCVESEGIALGKWKREEVFTPPSPTAGMKKAQARVTAPVPAWTTVLRLCSSCLGVHKRTSVSLPRQAQASPAKLNLAVGQGSMFPTHPIPGHLRL